MSSPNIPAGRPGLAGRAAARVIGRRAGQNRWMRAGYSGASAIARSFARTLLGLWHQVTGVFFLAFAIFIGIKGYGLCQSYAEGKTSAGRVWLAFAFAALFGYFAFSNLRRARRTS